MSLDDLHSQLHGALDQQFAALKNHYETAMAEARRQAQTDAERELQAKLQTARAEWEAQLNAQLAAVRTEAEQAAADAATRLRAALEHERDEALATARRSAELEMESERRRAAREVETERERSNSILEEARNAIDNERQRAKNDAERAKGEMEAVRAELQSEIAAATERGKGETERAKTDAQKEVDAVRAQLQSEIAAATERGKSDAERAKTDARNEIEAVRGQLQTEIAAAREEAAQEAAEKHAAVAAATAAKADMASREAAAVQSAAMYDRVTTSIRTLDGATTLGAALDALADGAGAIAGRAALFVISGDRLKAWKSVGLPEPDVQTVESAIGGRDLLAHAIQSGEPALSGPELPAPPFARLSPDHVSLAVPLMIAGRAVAVVYADGGLEGTSRPADWQPAVDMLARHTSALLALRTAMRTFDVVRGVPDNGANGDGAEESARRYAKLLVSEIKLYNEGAVRVGRQQRDLARRLHEEIERAQRLYEERVPAAIRARDTFFRQELVQTLAGGDASLLES